MSDAKVITEKDKALIRQDAIALVIGRVGGFGADRVPLLDSPKILKLAKEWSDFIITGELPAGEGES